VDAAAALTRHFIQERWKGLASIAWGDQLRQQRLDELIALEVLGVDLLPAAVVADGARHPDVVTEHAAIATEYHAE
jgi:glycerol-3-phosphate dehydrogenase